MIRKFAMAVAFLVLAGCGIYAQEPTISIAFDTDHFLFGQPVWVTFTIKNLSKEPIWVGGKEENGQFKLLERDARAFFPDGKEVPQHRGGSMVVGTRPTPKKKLICGDCVIWSQIVPVTDVSIDNLPSGKYNLIFYLKYSLKEEAGVFEKEFQTSATFYVDTPEGDDAAWLKHVKDVKKALYQKDTTRVALNQPLTWWDVLDYALRPLGSKDIGLSVLQKYPTSTYAAYVIYQSSGAKGLMASEPANIAKAITCGGINYPESVPDDTGKWKDGWQTLTAENYPKWRDKWFDIVLKNHPEIWFADALRLRKAVEDYSHKKTENLLTDIETLSKTGSPEVAKKAQEILAALNTDEGKKEKTVDTK